MVAKAANPGPPGLRPRGRNQRGRSRPNGQTRTASRTRTSTWTRTPTPLGEAIDDLNAAGGTGFAGHSESAPPKEPLHKPGHVSFAGSESVSASVSILFGSVSLPKSWADSDSDPESDPDHAAGVLMQRFPDVVALSGRPDSDSERVRRSSRSAPARGCVKTQPNEAHENFFACSCPRTRFLDEVNGLRSPEFAEIGVLTQPRAGLDSPAHRISQRRPPAQTAWPRAIVDGA